MLRDITQTYEPLLRFPSLLGVPLPSSLSGQWPPSQALWKASCEKHHLIPLPQKPVKNTTQIRLSVCYCTSRSYFPDQFPNPSNSHLFPNKEACQSVCVCIMLAVDTRLSGSEKQPADYLQQNAGARAPTPWNI